MSSQPTANGGSTAIGDFRRYPMNASYVSVLRLIALCSAITFGIAGCKGSNPPDEPSPDGDPVCGNGILEEGEACDDGNTASGDGCSSTCQIEDGWDCTEAGQPCFEITCDDSIVSSRDINDARNVTTCDCCSAT